jgi:hypothetical protein
MMVHIRVPEVVHSSIKHVVSQFTPPLWVAVIITMIILTLLLSATWYIGIHCNHHEELISYRLHETWLYTIGIMCQQGKVLPRLLFFSSSLLPHVGACSRFGSFFFLPHCSHTWERAPVSEHRADFTQFLNQDGR